MATDYSETSPVVKTTHGLVRGTLLKTLYDEPYYGFDGIPYGKPPIGELRFKAPQDSLPWNDSRDCTQPLDKCLQFNIPAQEVQGSEDCLYLNMSVKSLHTSKPLPVMVYVHGGRFKAGDASRRAWGPDYLMREQVVHISIGHRLGPFGFLSFADPSLEIPGNAGLKDIVLALKWIRANVSNFNGDANNITLFGHSSGSMMVHLLMVSPLTEGLFDKVILMAGFMHELNRLPHAEYRLAKYLGYQGENNDAEVFEFINRADPKLLASADLWTNEEQYRTNGMTPTTPCVEPYITPSAVLLAEPRQLQRTAWSNHIPLMVGSTSGEGLMNLVNVKKNIEDYLQHPENLLPSTLLLNCSTEKCVQMGRLLMEVFCKNSENSGIDAHCRSMCDVLTQSFKHNQLRVIKARLTYGQAENYLYQFDFDSPDFNLFRNRYYGYNAPGVVHGDELGYLYKLPATFKLDTNRAEYVAICRMAAMFAEFALRSNPNAPLTKSLVEWKPVSRDGPIMCLNINEELRFIVHPKQDKLEIFDELYKEANLELI